MKSFIYWGALALILSASQARGEADKESEIEVLRNELRELRKKTEELERRLIEYESARDSRRAPSAAETIAPPAGNRETDGDAVDQAPADPRGPEISAALLASKPWEAHQPLTLARSGDSYLNLSFNALVDAGYSTSSDVENLQRGDHDPRQRGFTLPNEEIALDGAVDPYFKGFANIAFKLDPDGETEVELEEAYALTTALPAGLQLKAGQFFAPFGRQNQQHPHQWSFVDQPLVLNRLLGPDGLRAPGAQVSWLAPTPFFSELSLTVMNSEGETAYSFRNPGEPDDFGVDRFHGRGTVDRPVRGPGDLLFVPRIEGSFDLTDNQTLALGTSAGIGPNATGPHARTEIFGIDSFWKWKSPRAARAFPFVSWQNEALYRRFEAVGDSTAALPLPSETLSDWGFYSQVEWGFAEGWVAGLRGEYVTGDDGAFDDDPLRTDRYRISPDLTWYPSHFSKIRLQYNYDDDERSGVDHSVWLQLEFSLGAHSAHEF